MKIETTLRSTRKNREMNGKVELRIILTKLDNLHKSVTQIRIFSPPNDLLLFAYEFFGPTVHISILFTPHSSVFSLHHFVKLLSPILKQRHSHESTLVNQNSIICSERSRENRISSHHRTPNDTRP